MNMSTSRRQEQDLDKGATSTRRRSPSLRPGKDRATAAPSFGLPIKTFLALCAFVCLFFPITAESTSNKQEGECATESSSSAPPGLYTPHSQPFTPIPEDVRRTVCICPWTEMPILRAFKSRNWKIIELQETDNENEPVYMECHKKGLAAVIWTKGRLPDWWQAQPWQRHNWIPTQNQMTHKGHFQRALLDHEANTGRKMPFIPDTYLLPADRERLLKRLQPQTPDNPEGGGDIEPWVIKLSATDNGVGVAIYGPNSTGVQHLNRTLLQNENQEDYMMPLREDLVLVAHKNDLRDPAAIQRARERSLNQNDDIVVQRYICHELDYHGRKFDLRLYYFVPSVDPLVVYYHDGALRVSMAQYNDKVFETTSDHLTNLGNNEGENLTVAFEDWELELKAHVAAHPSRFPPLVAADPLEHIRNQAKAAIAELVAATRDKAFEGPRGDRTRMENVFALLGADFIVDADLHVWMTEAQTSPGFGHETRVRSAVYEQLLPSMVDIIMQVIDKQQAGLPLFPMENTGRYELIYTDDYKFTYDFQHKKQQRGPC